MTVRTAIAQQVVGATFADTFGSVEMPHKELCVGYWWLGVDDATSILNRIFGGAPLAVVGTNDYEVDCAVMKSSAGFNSPNTISAYNRTVAVVYQDPHNPPLSGNPPATAQPGEDISANIVSWNSGNQFGRYLGATFTYRPTDGATGSDVAATYPDQAGHGITDVPPTYYPDGSFVRASRFRQAFFTSNATKGVLHITDEQFLARFEAAHVTLSVAAAATHFGQGGAATIRQRCAAIVEFNQALTDDQIADVSLFLRAEMAGRGIRC